MTSTIQAALEQGEGRPGRNKSLKAGASAEPGSRAVPKTTCIDGVGHFSGLGAKHGLGALRPALGQYFASMRRIEELIQYRAQFKIDRLSNSRGLRLRPKLTALIEKRTLNRASKSRNVIR